MKNVPMTFEQLENLTRLPIDLFLEEYDGYVCRSEIIPILFNGVNKAFYTKANWGTFYMWRLYNRECDKGWRLWANYPSRTDRKRKWEGDEP